MTATPIARAVSCLAVAVAVAGCAATRLPAARPLQNQSEYQFGWDSRTCAWAAQDVSGYDQELSPEENDIVNLFVRGQVGGPAESGADAVSWRTADIPAVAASQGGTVSRDMLGRGGRKKFDQAYEQCMTRRGYAVSSPVQEEKTR